MYRVFVCYSQKNRDFVESIVKILKKNGLNPQWAPEFSSGQRFSDEIKKAIAHAHVFMPVITPESNKRNWVHEEIGYAMALNIPLLPIAKGELPGEMLRELQAELFEGDMEKLQKRLSKSVISGLVRRYSDQTHASYQCAEFGDERTVMMAAYADEIPAEDTSAVVRQKGALSSFHIPTETLKHSVWRARYGRVRRPPEHFQKLMAERKALGRHAEAAGCRLIVNPAYKYNEYGLAARIVRLQYLVKFLESVSDDKCQIAFSREMEKGENLTIVGDWFATESVKVKIGEGYSQTIFTRHAPSMLSRIETFDQEMDERLESAGWTRENSRVKAIAAIRRIVARLEKRRSSR